MSENVFEAGDPFEDPAWKETEKPKRKRRNGRLIGCPLPWFVWVNAALSRRTPVSDAECASLQSGQG